MKELAQNFAFESWGKVDDTHTAVRFVISFMTKEEAVDGLISQL